MNSDETERHRKRWIETSQRRTELFNCAQFSWIEHHSYEVGSVRQPAQVANTGEADDSPIFAVGIPHERREFPDLKKSLSINGNMMRYKTHSLSIVDQLNIHYIEHEASNNGDYSRMTTCSGEQQQGLLHYDQKVNAYSANFRLMPIMLAIRAGDDKRFGEALQNALSPESDPKMAVEDDLFRIEVPKERIWLDPSKGYLPVRIERRNPRFDLIIDTSEIELSEHPQYGWLPSAWTYTKFGISGNPTRTFVTSEVEVSTTATTKSDFELKFWPGTRVNQRRGDGRVWIATETGDLRLADDE